MKRKSFLLGVVLGGLFFLPAKVWAQAEVCPNINFSYGTLTFWQCYQGSCAGTSYWVTPGHQIPGKIDIMNRTTLEANGQLYDEYCPVIPKVPDGYNFSCRIGNSNAGSEVDAVEYTLTVDSNSSLLMIGFAWVMEYPAGHSGFYGVPGMIAKLKDAHGNIIAGHPCNPINFLSDPTPANLACSAISGSVYAMDWIFTGYSLEDLIEQTVKIYFETRDCSDGGHFGYGYIVCECRPMRIEVEHCKGSPAARLIAPEGFVSYEWTRSKHPSWRATTRQINISNPMDGEIFSCTVKNNLGCYSVLKMEVVTTSIEAKFGIGYQGQGPFPSFYDWYDTCARRATFIDLSTIQNGKKERIQWEIHGLNARSSDSIWRYTFPDVDTITTYLVRLTVIAENGCADTTSQPITIYPSAKVKIDGVTELCEGKDVYLKPRAVRSQFVEHYWSGSAGTHKGDSLKINTSGIYYLMSKDTNDCYAYDTLVVTPLKAIIDNLQIRHVDCYGNATGQFSHGQITGGTPPYTEAKWRIWDKTITNFRDSNIIGLIGNPVFMREQIAGNYHFSAIDAEGCKVAAMITIQQPDSLYFTSTAKPTTCSKNNGEIAFEVIGGTLPYNISINGINKTNTLITNLSAGVYFVEVSDKNNCLAFDTIVVAETPFTYLASMLILKKTIVINRNCDTLISIAVIPQNACNKAIAWHSKDENIAIVNANGRVTGIAYGETYIIATSDEGGLQDSCKIIVTDVGVVNYELRITNYVVYPNPTNGQLRITNYELRNRTLSGAEVEIFSIVGQVVFTTRLSELPTETIIDISHLANGLYFLKIDNKMIKVMKQ